MPERHPATGPKQLLLRPAHWRGAIRYGLAFLIGLTAPDATVAPVRLPQARLVAAGVAQPGPRLSAAAPAAVSLSISPLEAPSLQPVKHALRVVSSLLVKTSQQSKVVAVRVSTIIGFRG